jgi:hypothetical protein
VLGWAYRALNDRQLSPAASGAAIAGFAAARPVLALGLASAMAAAAAFSAPRGPQKARIERTHHGPFG